MKNRIQYPIGILLLILSSISLFYGCNEEISACNAVECVFGEKIEFNDCYCECDEGYYGERCSDQIGSLEGQDYTLWQTQDTDNNGEFETSILPGVPAEIIEVSEGLIDIYYYESEPINPADRIILFQNLIFDKTPLEFNNYIPDQTANYEGTSMDITASVILGPNAITIIGRDINNINNIFTLDQYP